METKEYRTKDKTSWAAGPWKDEPDKMQWQDEATNLPCLIVRGPSGALCGYVGVTEEHKFYGKGYSECPETPACEETYCSHTATDILNVHGGITFADFCANSEDESNHICHVPGEGEPDHVWWLGFDCSHAGDYCPSIEATLSSLPGSINLSAKETYKTFDYVQHQVTLLAEQLASTIKR